MPKTRVLVVDDSVVVRRLLSEVIGTDPSCEVVGTAANGKIALAKIPQCSPDIVTLDVEMPEMDGLETLAEIRKLYPKLPVIMFSALTEKAADATLRALALGATDYVTKPTAAKGGGVQQVRDELLPKIACLAPRKEPPRALAPAPVAPPRLAVVPGARSAARAARIEIVAVGSSTGGPNALTALLANLSASFPVPIVITQHMPPLFTRLLAERMNHGSPLQVHEAAGGEVLEPGHAYVAPGDFHMEVRRDGTRARLALTQDPPVNSCRPAVDVMIRSVVATYAGGTLAVVLTGMGQDGMRGCELVREAGGQVVVQDEPTSVVWGMPGAVARAGYADAILPLAEIAGEVSRRVSSAAALQPRRSVRG